jgi:mono/diheme cytochrome c family protein
MRRSTVHSALSLGLVIALVLSFGLVAACGGDSDDGAPTEETAEPTSTAGGSGDGDIDAAALYSASCATCHGAEGQGASAPDLQGFEEGDLASVEQQIREGGSRMPAFGDQFSDEEIGALAEYVVAFGQ